jgi:hypothetical protein
MQPAACLTRTPPTTSHPHSCLPHQQGDTEASASELVDDQVAEVSQEVGGFEGGLERHTGHSAAQGFPAGG